jgi:hypothetical protein
VISVRWGGNGLGGISFILLRIECGRFGTNFTGDNFARPGPRPGFLVFRRSPTRALDGGVGS